MSPDIAALRSNRAVVVSVIVAAVAVTTLALIGIAKLLGWVPSNAALSTPVSVAAPGNQVAGTAPELSLSPGESVVVPADTSKRPAPMMPHYAPPAPPTPAPAPGEAQAAHAPGATQAAPAPGQAPSAAPRKPVERAKPRVAARPEPRTPSFFRGGAHPTSPTDTWPNPAPCEHCGRVIATTTWPDMAEVRIRFEDGSTRTLRSPAPSPWHVGDRVRLEHGRIVRD